MPKAFFTVGVFVGGTVAGLLLARYAIMLVNLKGKLTNPQPQAQPSQPVAPQPASNDPQSQVMSGEVNSRYHLYPGSMYGGRAR